MRYNLFVIVLLLLLLGSCHTKKSVVESSQMTMSARTETASSSSSDYMDSLWENLSLSIDKLTIESLTYGAGETDSQVQDSACLIPGARLSDSRKLIMEGVRLSKDKASQMNISSQQSLTNDSVYNKESETSVKVRSPTLLSNTLGLLLLIITLIVAGYFIYNAIYKRIHK